MTKYTVDFRKKEEDPKDEAVIASYNVDALKMEEAAQLARVLFAKEFPDLDQNEYDPSTGWTTLSRSS